MIITKVASVVVVVGLIVVACSGGGAAQPTKNTKGKAVDLKNKQGFQKGVLKHIPFKNTLKEGVKPFSSSLSTSSSSVSFSVSSSSSSSSSSSTPSLSDSSFTVPPTTTSPSSSSRPTRPPYIDSVLFRHQVVQARARTTTGKHNAPTTVTPAKLEAQTEPTTPLEAATTTGTTQDTPRSARLLSGVDSYDYEGYFGVWDDLVPFGGELGVFGGDRRGERYIGGFRPPGY